MTQTTSRLNSGSGFLNPKLRELLEKNELDWDNPRHREMYLKYWLSQPLVQEEDRPLDDR